MSNVNLSIFFLKFVLSVQLNRSIVLGVMPFDMICFSETFLDSFYADDDTRLYLKDFILIRADNPYNCKGVGVSIYFKKHLAVF